MHEGRRAMWRRDEMLSTRLQAKSVATSLAPSALQPARCPGMSLIGWSG